MAVPTKSNDEDIKPDIKPNLKAIEGRPSLSKPFQGSPKSKDKSLNKSLSNAALQLKEKAAGKAGDAAMGVAGAAFGYNPEEESGKVGAAKRFSRVYKQQRSKALLGGGIVGGLIALFISIFIAIIPLKIESIVNNLEDRFDASAQNALSGTTELLFSDYMKDVLSNWPHSSSCTSTLVDKNCRPAFIGSDPISTLYRTWAQNGLETKLAQDYGIEFRYVPETHSYYLKTPGDPAPQVDGAISGAELGDLDHDMFNDGTFAASSRNEIRQTVRDALKKETLFNRVWLHFKVSRLLEEKYGIKLCVVFCGTRDQLADAVAAGKNVAKILFVSRVITPHAQALGLALTCLFDDSCMPDQTTTSTSDDIGDADLGGSPESPTDLSIREKLTSLFEQFGSEDPAAMVQIYADIEDAGGVQDYIIQQVLTVLFDSTVADASAQVVDKAVPIIGWINLASQIVNITANAGPKIKKLSYVIGASSAVSTYMLYRSYADEVKTGQANATEVGQFDNSLGPTTTADPVGGGTASAEQTPLYGSLIDGNQPLSASSSSLLNNVLPDQAYAATATTAAPSPAYKCADGSTPETTADPGIVCNEELLGGGNATLNAISNAFNQIPVLDVIKHIASVWQESIGKLFGLFGDLINLVTSPLIGVANDACNISGGVPIIGPVLKNVGPWGPYCEIKDVASTVGSYLMKFVIGWLIPTPFSPDESGGRTFDEMAAGADVTYNDSAHQQLGGRAVSNQQVLAAYNQQQSDEQFAFSKESFFSRLFDTSTPYSFISKVAMAMPFNLGSSIQGDLGGFFQDPLGGIVHGVAALADIGRVNAATPAPGCPGESSQPGAPGYTSTAQYDDFFCVTQYGYTQADISAIGNPKTYWTKNCADNSNINAGQTTVDWNNAVEDATGGGVASVGGSGGSVGPATAFEDPNSGIGVNTTTDPCLLIQATTGSAGALFDPSLLTPDEQAGTAGQTTTASSGQNYVAQAVAPSNTQPTSFFAILFRNFESTGKTIEEPFKDLNVMWTARKPYE